jgi:hypothetical protein
MKIIKLNIHSNYEIDLGEKQEENEQMNGSKENFKDEENGERKSEIYKNTIDNGRKMM